MARAHLVGFVSTISTELATEDLALHASAHHGALPSLPHRYAADQARDLRQLTVARRGRDQVRD
jgi:hypothetical protein